MIYKFLGALIISAAALMIFLTLKEDSEKTAKYRNEATCIQLTPAQHLIKIISDDFNSLAQSKQLPEDWQSIATIEIKFSSELARIILGKARPQFPITKKGKAHLELEIMDLPDNENPGLIIQASLFEIKSRNKIFELGRTYTMNDLNKVHSMPGKLDKKTK